MDFNKRIIILVAALQIGNASAGPNAGNEPIEIPVENVLAPTTGYEEKNNIQVVISGSLPNFCYTLSEARFEQNPIDRVIKVKQYATRQSAGVCADENALPRHMAMSIPFTTELSIGNLAMGNYQVTYNHFEGKVKARPLSVSGNIKPTIDTLPYAAVSKIMALPIISSQEPVEVTINGMLNSTCTELDPEVKILNEEDVYVLMPTVRIKKGVICLQVLIPFEKKVNLGRLSTGQYLIHTRSMHGNSLNQIIQVN